jgi:glycosyltransferase involved in cell wall biosynthesis
MSNSILISVILTVRNEEKYIKKCIDSILLSEIPENLQLELIAVDGMSTDTTCEIIESLSNSDVKITIIKNEQLNQSHGFNLGVMSSSGQWVVWLGAHSIYNKGYILGLYNTANSNNSDYTGGVINTLPYDSTYSASVVQAITTHKFGVGNSGFRTNAIEGTADTASYGIFNKEIFSKIGYFDERLLRAQDYEYNCRIRKSGGKVWLNPNLVVDYYNQPNMQSFLKKQLLREAPYSVYMWYLAPHAFAFRHAITGIFSLGVIGGVTLAFVSETIKWIFLAVMILYLILAIASTIQQAVRYKKILHLLTLPIGFFLYHFLHGVGILSGIAFTLIGKSPVQKRKEPWRGYGHYRVKITSI